MSFKKFGISKASTYIVAVVFDPTPEKVEKVKYAPSIPFYFILSNLLVSSDFDGFYGQVVLQR